MFSTIGHIVSAQGPPASLKELGLKGRVKQVIEDNYDIVRNNANGDSLKHVGKRIKNFDENGNQLDESSYDKGGDLESKFTFDYSKARKVIASAQDNNGNLLAMFIIKYDDRGNEIELSPYLEGAKLRGPGPIKFKAFFKYDGRNDRVEMDTYTPGINLHSKEIFVYNDNHQIIEKYSTEESPNGVIKKRITLKYSSGGNQIEEESYDSKGRLKSESTTLYSNIDVDGNWLIANSQFKYHNGDQRDYISKDVAKREIVYFK